MTQHTPDDEHSPAFSVIVPARNEEAYIPACLDAIEVAAEAVTDGVEVVVVINRCTDRTEEIAKDRGARVVHCDAKNLSVIRNAGANAARGKILVTVDADSVMSPNMLSEITRYAGTGRHVGGSPRLRPERYSVGIVVFMFLIWVVLTSLGVWGGLYWCKREDFEAIGGFNEDLLTAEDVDFARRLKAHGKTSGRRMVLLRKAHIVTSCRKFDKFGDWVLITHPRLIFGLAQMKNQRAANTFFYDVER